MSPTGRAPRGDATGAARWQFLSIDLPPGTGFGRHRHEDHQLALVDRGVVGLATRAAKRSATCGRSSSSSPIPNDPAAHAVASALLADPRDDRTIDELAASVGASGRTLQRRFSEETGLGFRAWRRRSRLQRAMADLTRGGSVTAVAYACGYASVSAFVTAFRTELGTTPAEWARADRSLDADPAAAANLSDPDGGLR